ncbi:putative laccase-2 [Rhizodiscina lignyota]|uniref:Laccase-2 n=1 Tax=Rhizodiscina lignyota TaxID=1504668 RepID=A0A9P4IP49_9PEZI|nr:putative laccase-2 [Rhizodiscina lignyota]
MDGVVSLTQCAIPQFGSFTYRFKIGEDEAGTFWYHAHSDVHRADGLFGALVVHKPVNSEGSAEMQEYHYDAEQLLLVGDWFHRPAESVLESYLDYRHFKIEPAPDSILVNGRGAFNCSRAVPSNPVECTDTERPAVSLPEGRTRLRIMNTGSITGFSLAFGGFQIRVIQVDGGGLVSEAPSSKAVGVLYPGERMDLIIERAPEENVQDPMLTIQLDMRDLAFPNLALVSTQQFPVEAVGQISEGVSQKPNDTLVLYTNIEYLTRYGNIPKGFVNRTSWTLSPSVAPLVALGRFQRPSDVFIPAIAVSEPGKEKDVIVVLNNMDDKSHPFHLHGHSFDVLASHEGKPGSYDAYNPFSDEEPAGGPLNLRNPVKKDTVVVPRSGYVVLRFSPDNEGLWLFHCHVLWHQAVGMAMAFEVGRGSDQPLSENARALCAEGKGST